MIPAILLCRLAAMVNKRGANVVFCIIGRFGTTVNDQSNWRNAGSYG